MDMFSIKKHWQHVDKSIKIRKKNGTKINQGTFRIDKNVQLIEINAINCD